MARAAGVGSAGTLKVTALVGAIAVLSLLNWHLYTTALDIAPLAPDTRAAASNEAKEVDLSTPLDDKPLIGFEETVQRPLFNADRKPIVRNKEVAAAAPQPLSTGMQLVGIVKSDAGTGADPLPGRAGRQMGARRRDHQWLACDERQDRQHRARGQRANARIEAAEPDQRRARENRNRQRAAPQAGALAKGDQVAARCGKSTTGGATLVPGRAQQTFV